jgi:hypothetical protein
MKTKTDFCKTEMETDSFDRNANESETTFSFLTNTEFPF